MKNLLKLFLLTLSLIFITYSGSNAQVKTSSFDPMFRVYEDSLKSLSFKLINSTDEIERRNSTFVFIKTLVSALKLPRSFEYSFDSVKSISILKSRDQKFRIFTWHLNTDDGNYRYYGAIQKNNPEKLELYSLFDNSAFIPNPEDTIVDKDGWFGAHYYSIVEPRKRKNDEYILLGWKGHDTKITQKVIEVLSFDDNGKPVFGAPIFEYKNKTKTRVVFLYSARVSMLLRYLAKKNWIVYDHLAAPNGKSDGMYEIYGPDLSYDGLKYRRKKWILMEKIDIRNEKSEMDKFFNDPNAE